MRLNLGVTKALRTASGNLAARRGSTLILVVATLALLAVLTVAYVSIGGGDRRSARTTTRAAEVERQAEHVANYLVGIVGDDALSVYFEGFDPSNQPIFMTEAVDLPRTDPNRTFNGDVAPGMTPELQDNYYGLRFTPTGSLPPLQTSDDPSDLAEDLFQNNGFLLPFGPSDPFLAASEPTFIREAGDSFSDPAYFDRIDWAKISNISPNGLFVNLFNLRGNFDAEPGIGTGQMSQTATMWLNDDGAAPVKQLANGDPAHVEIPAHFDSNLLSSYLPVNFDNGFTVVSDRYLPYMWADADGDGFFDARWQELVDVTFPGGPQSVIPSEGQLRWFVAARIIDLSGRVNVNTARGLLQFDGSSTSYMGEPTNARRLGASPGDIDLRRILNMEPQWAMFGEFYDTAPQPTSGGAQDYSGYSDYSVALGVGEEGFSAVRRTLAGEQPAPGVLDLLDAQTPDQRFDEYSGLRYGGASAVRTASEGVYQQSAFGLEDLRDLLAYEGLNDPSSLSNLERASGGRSALAPGNFGPLRENRSLQWERDLADPAAALALRHTSVRRQITTLSGGILRVPTRVAYSTSTPTALDVFTSISRLSGNTLAEDPAEENPSVLQDGYVLLQRAAPIDLPENNPGVEAERRLLRNAHPLFRTYANALAPAAEEPGAWNMAGNPEWATTFYGSDPLFALRSAAHMAANMTDMFDGDDTPSAYTLLVQGDSAGVNVVQNNPDVFPWWTMPEPTSSNPGVSGRLDLGDARLPSGPAESLGVAAMNVYGLEVHPFITQVSMYNVYTDSDEGDYEGPPPGSGTGGGVFGPGAGTFWITMDFDTDFANVDYIGQIFAVQLSNPYTTDIDVRDEQYYVRFGNLGGDGMSSPIQDGVKVPAGTVIPAGESVVVYLETPDFAQRAMDAAPSFAPVTMQDVQDWIDSHLHSEMTSVGAIRFDAMVNIDDFLVSTPGDTSPAGDPNRQVTLWTPLNFTDSSGAPTRSFVMLDKMYDPALPSERPTLDRRPPAINIKVEDAEWGDDTGSSEPAAEENTGYSLVTWGTFARPTGSTAAPLGALPAYILEKPFLDPGIDAGMSMNTARTDGWMLPTPPSAVFTLNATNFSTSSQPAFDKLSDVFTRTLGSGTGSRIRTDILLEADDTSHFLRQQIAEYNNDLYVSPLRNDNRGLLDDTGTQVPMLRPGDFLGVPALGPVQMPVAVGGSVPMATDISWFTTGELLTLALGFDKAPSVNDPAGWYPSIPEDTSLLLDRGHLSLDLPAPFVDNDGTGDFDSANDDRRGLGVPHAMALVSSITTIPVPEITSRNPVAGLVNLNTATEAAMSVLPGLTPTLESTIDPTFTWIRNGGALLHDQRSDVASGVLSYRDKAAARPRAANPGAAAAAAVPFFEPASWGDLDPFDLEGRQTTTDIEGLREHPGMLSVGELLAVHQPPASGGGGGGGLGGAAYPQPHLLRRLGYDNQSIGVPGVDSVLYGPGGDVALSSGTDDDGIRDDYDEQLALYNGVANSVAVRSDVYAIWFVMHGYAREDVEGLRPDDPMTPSVARRYLIVVDRSNVRRAGDKPRVLLFDELPL
ncbi:MAG: hypothetical protein ACIAQU_04030 [Phycisphaerales bacterium JB064]